MRLNDTAGILLSSVTAAYLATQSVVVSGTVAAAVILLSITDDHRGSLINGNCRCAGAGPEEERS
ncbi:MAG: hypothetical protein ABW046_17105 [Actinoplanes sp.]